MKEVLIFDFFLYNNLWICYILFVLRYKGDIKIKGVKNVKATGRTRPVDGLGRVVIPKEIRKAFDIVDNQDSLEIFTEDNMIILKKYEPCCTFCGEGSNIVTYKEKNICRNCLEEITHIKY